MSEPEQVDVLILGSGAGGKLLAWHMEKSGRGTDVVERRWIGGSGPLLYFARALLDEARIWLDLCLTWRRGSVVVVCRRQEVGFAPPWTPSGDRDILSI